ncbi:thioesterase domain-containing protein [Xanthobacteraceae bacterium A53D]
MTSRFGFALPRVFSLFLAALFLTIAAGSAHAQSGPRVYLMRGLANVFSTGMDDLARKMQAQGINAQVYEHGQWAQLADDAVAWSKASRRGAVVIIGHSLGADSAIEMAQRMTAQGVAPRLVVTFDPVGVTTVGAAGGRFINYYQSNNGFGKRLTAAPGFKGTLANRNQDGAAGIDHFNIEKSDAYHQQVIAMVRALNRPPPRPKPAPAADPAVPSAAAPAERPATETVSATVAAPAATR